MRALGRPRHRVGVALSISAAVTVTLALVLAAATAAAAVFVVNATFDVTAGFCGTTIGECTLHDALDAAIATPGRDTINFDPNLFRPGNPGVISLVNLLPIVADPAGTVVDGAGAGVIIELGGGGGIGDPIDGLVFASAAGVPLADVRVANLTIRGFTGRGIVICGGDPAACADDVTKPVVQNVVVHNNGAGLDVSGRTVSRLSIVDTVARSNGGTGIRIAGTQSVVGTRLTRPTAVANGGAGIFLGNVTVLDTAITDAIVTINQGTGIAFEAGDRIAKTKLTAVAAIANQQRGIDFSASTSVTATSIAGSISSKNSELGIAVAGGAVAATTIKDLAVIGNDAPGIVVSAALTVTGTKITHTKVTGNGLDGIVIAGDDTVSGSKLTDLALVGNGGDGLRYEGFQNVAQRVRASGNHGNGIRLGPNHGSGGNVIAKSSFGANDGNGIVIADGNTGNVVQKNVSFAHDGADLRDENPGCGGNVWKQNVFETRNDPCIQ